MRNPDRARRRTRTEGYTLFEIMVTISIIAIVASFAIPAMADARRSANETSAIAMTRALFDAQQQFQRKNPDGKFASGLFFLEQEGLLPAGLEFTGVEDGTVGQIYKRGGYEFASTVSVVDNGLLIVAQPIELNRSGSRSFLQRDDGVIFERIGPGFVNPSFGTPVGR